MLNTTRPPLRRLAFGCASTPTASRATKPPPVLVNARWVESKVQWVGLVQLSDGHVPTRPKVKIYSKQSLASERVERLISKSVEDFLGGGVLTNGSDLVGWLQQYSEYFVVSENPFIPTVRSTAIKAVPHFIHAEVHIGMTTVPKPVVFS